MRDGYLGALAARTLGVAPLLRPVTPSRFEPDGPVGAAGGLHVSLVSEAVDTPGARPPRSAPGPERTQHPAPPPSPRITAMDDAPLLPPIDPDRPASGVVRAVTPAGAEGFAPARTFGDADGAALGIAELAGMFALPPADADGDGAAPGPDPVPGLGFGRAGAATRPAAAGRERGTAQAAAADAPPPVVVHIGSIEVRAGESAPRPAPAPRPVAAPPGRSLADYLAARDRELS